MGEKSVIGQISWINLLFGQTSREVNVINPNLKVSINLSFLHMGCV